MTLVKCFCSGARKARYFPFLISYPDSVIFIRNSSKDTEDQMARSTIYFSLAFQLLEFMDPDERREVLEDAGLDPDEFDF